MKATVGSWHPTSGGQCTDGAARRNPETHSIASFMRPSREGGVFHASTQTFQAQAVSLLPARRQTSHGSGCSPNTREQSREAGPPMVDSRREGAPPPKRRQKLGRLARNDRPACNDGTSAMEQEMQRFEVLRDAVGSNTKWSCALFLPWLSSDTFVVCFAGGGSLKELTRARRVSLDTLG